MNSIRSAQLKKSRVFVWALFAIPALHISVSFLSQRISYGQYVHLSGDWSIGFLVLAMLVTPLRRHFPNSAWVRVLVYHRRALGVASFIYASLHTAAYLERKWGASLIFKEAQAPGLATAWIALFLFALLATTSNNRSVAILKSSWKKLHRLVYPAALLVFVHWILTAFEPKLAYICLISFITLQLLRFLPRRNVDTKKAKN